MGIVGTYERKIKENPVVLNELMFISMDFHWFYFLEISNKHFSLFTLKLTQLKWID